MLGQPVSMLIPRVVGFKLTGEIPPGATATDVVLTITEMLRKHGVVGKFVEFYGAGVAAVPLANRATIGNMSPEFGSTAAMFPIDEETIDYLRLTGRTEEQVALVEAYAKAQGLWHDPDTRAGLLRVPRAGPVDGRAVDRRPEAPAGPDRAVRREDRVPQGHPRLRRRAAADARAPSRRGRRGVLPGQRPGRRCPSPTTDADARPTDSAADGAEGRPSKPDHGVDPPSTASSCSTTARSSIAGDHLLHQHLEPVGDARRRAAGPQRRREGPDGQAVGEDHDGARLAGRHRLLREGRPLAVPGEARLLPGRLRLHHLHRQLRPAARRDLAGDQRQRPRR